jgi:hypothetical protein
VDDFGRLSCSTTTPAAMNTIRSATSSANRASWVNDDHRHARPRMAGSIRGPQRISFAKRRRVGGNLA